MMKEYIKPVAELIVFGDDVLSASACKCYGENGVKDDYGLEGSGCKIATYDGSEMIIKSDQF